jgi:LuxR family transcriptional regulator, maltose regulon positive regulatory protein
VLQGRLREAEVYYREAVRALPGHETVLPVVVGGPAYSFGLGDLLRERNDLDGAEELLRQGMDMLHGSLIVDADLVLLGHVALARIQQARGENAAATATLDSFYDLARKHGFVAEMGARAATAQAHLRLLQGDLAAAIQWSDRYAELRIENEELRTISSNDFRNSQSDTPWVILNLAPKYQWELEDLTLARVWIAQGRADHAGQLPRDALQLLDRLLDAAEAAGRIGSAIEILTLRALALHAQRDQQGALAALERALALAAPEGYARIFVDEGAPMRELLALVAARRSQVAEYANKLLAAFQDKETRRQGDKEIESLHTTGVSLSLVEPLTDREFEVLQLLARGRSNQAIARELFVAVGTVKRHVNSILGKLQAQSRLEAVARAREAGLLP